MECTVHIGGARLITIRQLASLVQLFLLKAEDFSLVFLSSSTSTYRISRSQPSGQGVLSSKEVGKSSAPPSSAYFDLC